MKPKGFLFSEKTTAHIFGQLGLSVCDRVMPDQLAAFVALESKNPNAKIFSMILEDFFRGSKELRAFLNKFVSSFSKQFRREALEVACGVGSDLSKSGLEALKTDEEWLFSRNNHSLNLSLLSVFENLQALKATVEEIEVAREDSMEYLFSFFEKSVQSIENSRATALAGIEW